jgi:hypothetical protein
MQKGGAAQHPGWSLWAFSQALKMDARDRMTTLGRIPKICYWTALSPLLSFPAQKFSLTFFFIIIFGCVCLAFALFFSAANILNKQNVCLLSSLK